MTDLDARVAALMVHADAFAYDKTLAGTCINRVHLEIAIRAELQKPALHESDAEEKLLGLASKMLSCWRMVERNNEPAGAAMQASNDFSRALHIALQGRAKPASRIPFAGYDPNFVPGSDPNNPQEEQSAQEEITDAERYQFAAKHCVLSGGGRFGWSIAPCTKAEWDRYLDAAIRASKGEKT